jgi:hypothetical protein
MILPVFNSKSPRLLNKGDYLDLLAGVFRQRGWRVKKEMPFADEGAKAPRPTSPRVLAGDATGTTQCPDIAPAGGPIAAVAVPAISLSAATAS